MSLLYAAEAAPTIQIAPEHQLPAERIRRSFGQTSVGGYGQFNGTWLRTGPDASFVGDATVKRFVLYVGHDFATQGAPVSLYAEMEWENAMVCDGCIGSTELEQGYIDWQVGGDAFTLRGGLVLIPMGIVNQWHEPTVFNGVERPGVDRYIIPTTWRELGVGAHGQPLEWLRYEAYLTTALDPSALSSSGLAPAKSNGSSAVAGAGALSGRVELMPTLGVTLGGSGYASDLGGNAEFYNVLGQEQDLLLPLLGWSTDARLSRWGLQATLLWASFSLPESDDLLESFRADGSPMFPNATLAPVATKMHGGYIDIAYDLFHRSSLDHTLSLFARAELYDTQAKVPEGTTRDPSKRVVETTLGLSYKPIPQLVLKTDVQLRDRELGLDELQINAGLGFVY